MGPPPGKKPKKAKPGKTPKPKKDPKPRKPKKGRKSKETPQPEETPLVGRQGEDPLIQEQDPAPGNDPVPRTAPRPGDTDPLEGETSPLRPEGEPTPLGMDQGQVDVGSIPLPPGPPPTAAAASTNSTAGVSDTANATNAGEGHAAADPRAWISERGRDRSPRRPGTCPSR